MVQIGSEYPLDGRFAAPDDVVARARQENFPVASRLLPRDARRRLMAIYGFARLADDLGDEAQGDRLELLDWLEAELALAVSGKANHAVLQRLSPLLCSGELSLEPFLRLIEANRMDQRVQCYETYVDLVGYCMLSAAPVGRLVLEVFSASTPERVALSDDVCIGLQIVEHLQDVGEDAARGRIYLPQEDLERFGCSAEALRRSHADGALRRLVAAMADRARCLLGAGVPLARQLSFQSRLAVSGFTAGGMAALDAIGRAEHDVLSTDCRPKPTRLVVHLLANVVAASRGGTAP